MSDHDHNTQLTDTVSQLSLAHSATWHCLMGCGLGEVVGIIIGTALDLPNIQTVVLALVLGFVFGFVFGLWPLLRAGYDISRAVRQVLVAETLSIVVMEAGLGSWLFWFGMGLSLVAGYVAAFPVNYVLVGKGIRHVH